jgi:2-oxoglutarate dehydrogenase E1 component
MDLGQFSGLNAGYVLELYEKYRQNPESVDPATRAAFGSWTPPEQLFQSDAADRPAVALLQHAPAAIHVIVGAANLAESLRRFGHLAARIDPLGATPAGDPSLSPRAHAISDDDLRQLPASLVGGPVAESSANAYEAIEKLRRV